MKSLIGVVQKGDRVASGLNPQSPYPHGSIAMQEPFFKKAGLDLSNYFLATLNIDITPKAYKVIKADYEFKEIKWFKGIPAESFSFVHMNIIVNRKKYHAWLYYPDPKTKIQHFKSASTMEIIAPFIENIKYGDSVTIEVDPKKLKVVIGDDVF